MKKLICIFLAAVLALSFAACSGKEQKESKSASQTETQSQAAEQEEQESQIKYTNEVSVSAPVMQTDDWSSYDFTEYKEKDKYKVNLSIPDGYTCDGTVISDKSGNKYAEINGIVALKDGQTAFDTIKENQTNGDIKYLAKVSDKLEYGGVTRPASVVVAEAPTDNGKGVHYLYMYAVEVDGYTVEVTFNLDEFVDDVPTEHKAVLSSITVG